MSQFTKAQESMAALQTKYSALIAQSVSADTPLPALETAVSHVAGIKVQLEELQPTVVSASDGMW